MKTLAEGHRIGPYRIVRLLGAGGMGMVYEARRDLIDRRVALKTLHPQYALDQVVAERFITEAKVLSQLEHLSIVNISDFGFAEDGTAYLVMEYLHGESLAACLQRHARSATPFPLVRVLRIAWQAADVLATCHGQGIIHRDLKPENIMLIADPVAPGGERVKVLDFGIAKWMGNRGAVAPRTGTGEMLGTPMYMSPEQVSGTKTVDGKTDVYALGCVLYQALSGKPPFVADECWQLVGMHLFQTPVPLQLTHPQIPEDVCKLVHSLLGKDRTLRPAMSEVALALSSLLTQFSDVQASHSGLINFKSTIAGKFFGNLDSAKTRRIISAWKNPVSRRTAALLCSSVAIASTLVWTGIIQRSVSRHFAHQPIKSAAAPDHQVLPTATSASSTESASEHHSARAPLSRSTDERSPASEEAAIDTNLLSSIAQKAKKSHVPVAKIKVRDKVTSVQKSDFLPFNP